MVLDRLRVGKLATGALVTALIAASPADLPAQRPAPRPTPKPKATGIPERFHRASTERMRLPGTRAPLVVVGETEPNDQIADADPVSLGDTAAGTITPALDKDYFALALDSGKVLDVDVDAYEFGSSLDPVLTLLDSAGYTLAFNDDADGLDSRIRYSVVATATYYVVVAGFSGSGGPTHTYTLNLNEVPPGPGDPVTVLATGFQIPWALTADRNGDLLVVDNAFDTLTFVTNAKIYRVTTAGVVTMELDNLPFINDVVLDAFGRVLALAEDGVVYEVREGTLTPLIGGSGFSTAIAVSPDGDIWVARDNTIERYDPFGNQKERVSLGFLASRDMGFAPNGILYFTDGYDRIYRIVDGQPVEFIQVNPDVQAIAFDSAGNFYVVRGFQGEVSQYDTTGSAVADPFAHIDMGLVGHVAFGRGVSGQAVPRLFVTNFTWNPDANSYAGSLVELNAVGITAPGWPDLNLFTMERTGLPDGVVGVAYSDTLRSLGGSTPVTWSVVAGSLPAGLGIDTVTGVVSGTPTTVATYDFTMRAESGTLSDQNDFSVEIAPALSFTSADLAPGVMGTPYADTLTATGGLGRHVWSVASGGLPGGLALDSLHGVLAGVPAETGSFAFRVRVEAVVSNPVETDVTLDITAPTVDPTEAVAQLLGDSASLSPDQLRYLDLLGEPNGVLDVADVRALLVAMGRLPQSTGPSGTPSTAGPERR